MIVTFCLPAAKEPAFDRVLHPMPLPAIVVSCNTTGASGNGVRVYRFRRSFAGGTFPIGNFLLALYVLSAVFVNVRGGFISVVVFASHISCDYVRVNYGYRYGAEAGRGDG